MAPKVFVNGTVVCDALFFQVIPGRRRRVNAGSFGSPNASIPGLRELDQFQLLAPLSATQLLQLPDGLEVEEENGARHRLQASQSDLTSSGLRLTGYVQNS
jgi:hypothetical protein